MMETGKSLLLTILVFASLLQSYLLAYSTPNYDLVDQTEYIKTELIGNQKDINELIYPEDIILHFGNGKHSVIYPETEFYNVIFHDTVKNRRFEGLREASRVSWYNIRNDHKGIEIRFAEGIPLDVLENKDIMQIKGDATVNILPINRIFITNENVEEVRVFFFSDDNDMVYEATTADITIKDVETFVGFGEMQPLYYTTDGDLYIPEKALRIVKFKLAYGQYTPDQLLKSLFVDPSITRNLPERDGSMTDIYSDGKRGLQINKEQKWMIYSDPSITPGDSLNDLRANLFAAATFINQHGGWNGNYMISSISESTDVQGQTFIFRQYVQSYPVVPTMPDSFGYIKVVLQKGVVSNYERSLINLDSVKTEAGEAVLMGGSDLETLMRNHVNFQNIERVFPAYRTVLTDKLIEFYPVWAVKLKDDTVEYLK